MGSHLLMETVCNCSCEFVRSIKSYGEFEKPPPKDVFFVGQELVLIQPAQDNRRQRGAVRYFTGHQNLEVFFVGHVRNSQVTAAPSSLITPVEREIM